ncbi:Calcium-dependent lipid-binding family protein [Perilla frutescens var. hirtella]|nr:Calcium-dependent lipid-binding family protein [Perilla frutescens var. hirtella]
MGSVLDATILHHVCIVLILIWFLNSFNCCHPVAYFLSLIYLYLVHEVYLLRLRKKLQFEEKRESDQRRVLTDSESLRWLNHAIEKIWPICMEDIVSQKILLPIFPWFLKKYKPWTVKDVELQHLYLGRSPPMFTEMRVLRHSNGDDHLVLELGMNFRTADDMSAILGVKLRKRLGFGMWTKLHMLGMHVEGKVLVGVKFLRGWPFISRLRVCFSAPPYFQMTVKPLFTHGLDVTELPGIAGWIDNLLSLVFEQTLVEPNMLVVDVEKFASPQPENWFSVDAKEPIALAIVEILEATEMKPSDLNGLADPYVKGQLGPNKFRTRTQKKTLSPKWHEEFKIPIFTWESDNMLAVEVRDKDRVFDDVMGDCCVNINEHRDGQRHDMWLPLKNIKMGRLHLAVTVSDGFGKVAEPSPDEEDFDGDKRRTSFADDSSQKGSFSSQLSDKSPKVADKFDPIDIEGQSETGIWIHHPGSEVAQVWKPRTGKSKHLDSREVSGQIRGEVGDSVGGLNDSSSTDESTDSNKSRSSNPVKRGLRKIGSVFRRSQKDPDKIISPMEPEPSPQDNIRAVNPKKGGVRLIIDDTIATPKGDTTVAPSSKTPKGDEKELLEESLSESPNQRHPKDMAKSILKHAGKSARELKLSFSRKTIRKSKAEPETLLAELDSSDDESLSSSVDAAALADTGLVVPSSAISPPEPVSGNNSFKLKDDIQTATLSDNNSFKNTDTAVPTGDKG